MSSSARKPVSLAARREVKPAALPAPAIAPAEAIPAESIAVAVTLVFQVDGKSMLAMRVPGEFPKPPAGVAAHLEVTINARELLQRLEPALGPQAPHIWTPGA